MKRWKRLRRLAALLTAAVTVGSWSGAAAIGVIPDLHTQTAPAETASPDPAGFSFRNGIVWGTAAASVQEKEGQAMVERKQGDWSILYTQSRVEVSRYFADLVYMFYQDRLQMITYDFGTDAGNGSYTYLEGALSSVYGEMTEAPAADVIRAMDRIYPGYYTEGLLDKVRGWTAADGTAVYLYYYGAEAFAILYVSPEAALPGSGAYITTGL